MIVLPNVFPDAFPKVFPDIFTKVFPKIFPKAVYCIVDKKLTYLFMDIIYNL